MLPHTDQSFVPGALRVVGAATSSCTTRAPLVRMCGTAASVSTLLIVVGMPNSPATAGNGRLDARVAALPLEGVHHRRLFAADVRAGALVHPDVDALAGPHRVRADEPGGVRLVAPRVPSRRAAR